MATVTLPYPPSLNRLTRHFNGRAVKSEEARRYQREAAILAKSVMEGEPLTGGVVVRIRLHPRKPQRASKALNRCIDLDNAAKIALDSLNGTAWIDDRQVEQLYIVKAAPIEGGALIVSWEGIET